MENSKNNNGGIDVLGLLGVLFVALKITGVIDWSWWLVTLPFWIVLALIVLLFSIFLVVNLLASCKK